MADFGGFVKERDNLLAAAVAGQAQCSMDHRENVIPGAAAVSDKLCHSGVFCHIWMTIDIKRLRSY